MSTQGRVARQPRGDRKPQKTVRHGLAEGTPAGFLVVHVQRIEVAGNAGKGRDVRLGHGPTRAFPLVADGQIIESEGGDRVPCHHFHSRPRRILAKGYDKITF